MLEKELFKRFLYDIEGDKIYGAAKISEPLPSPFRKAFKNTSRYSRSYTGYMLKVMRVTNAKPFIFCHLQKVS